MKLDDQRSEQMDPALDGPVSIRAMTEPSMSNSLFFLFSFFPVFQNIAAAPGKDTTGERGIQGKEFAALRVVTGNQPTVDMNAAERAETRLRVAGVDWRR